VGAANVPEKSSSYPRIIAIKGRNIDNPVVAVAYPAHFREAGSFPSTVLMGLVSEQMRVEGGNGRGHHTPVVALATGKPGVYKHHL
jgi:hypothetical protein